MSGFIFAPPTAAPDAGADIARQTAVTLARLDERPRAERSSLADAVVGARVEIMTLAERG